jgi:hypothetical protein
MMRLQSVYSGLATSSKSRGSRSSFIRATAGGSPIQDGALLPFLAALVCGVHLHAYLSQTLSENLLFSSKPCHEAPTSHCSFAPCIYRGRICCSPEVTTSILIEWFPLAKVIHWVYRHYVGIMKTIEVDFERKVFPKRGLRYILNAFMR